MSTSSRMENGRPDHCASLGAMGSLRRKLKELTQTEDRESIICKFSDEIDRIYEKLEKLSEVRDPPSLVNCWMKDVRELSYDMEDFVNGLAHAHDAEAKVNKISEFQDEVVDAMERYDCYNLEECLKEDADTGVKLGLGSVFAETELVGMDDRIKELRSVVNGEEDSQLKVISILSVDEGVGKSMLAQKLWRDELKTSLSKEKQSETESCRAFVLMAKKPDMRMILRSILSQVCPHEPLGDYRVPNLIHDIRKHLQNKRYFIVIDDLWAISFWDIVRRAFPDGKKCSRIIITTAVEDVARACCSDSYNNIVNIKALSDKQCNELFFRRVFGPGKECPQQLNVVSDEITRKCGGLPLAIICIATLVASQKEENQESDIVKMEQQLNYVKNFLDDNLRTRPTSVEIINQVLKLCYTSLPHYLKTCLLYLSMYPENYLIMKEDLVKQWIAEGFVIEGKSTAKIAGSYFDVLVSLGLIQWIDIGDCSKQQHRREVEEEEEEEPSQQDSKRVSYVVHPTVFEFITCKSMEDNFITIIDYSQSKVALTERIHRLSLHFGSATYATTPTSIRLSQVRSLAFMGLLNCIPSLVEFKVVRVMILHIRSDDRDKRFSLKEIHGLDLLRYLQVRCNVTVELPGQVQCLKHLITLEINAGVADFPSDIVHHSTLQHVRIGKRTEYKNLAQGPVTTIRDDLRSKHLPDIEVLELLPTICIFSKLPGWMGQLTSLRILEVVVRELEKYELDHIGKLPTLAVLSLYIRKPNRSIVTFHKEAPFPALEYFKIVSGVLLLSFPEKAMPKLRRLKICFNVHSGDKYNHMLGGIQHLLKLEEVAASIGVATGADKTHYRAAVSALEDTIGKHPYGAKFPKKKMLPDPVDEEYDRPVRQVVEPSSKWDEDLKKQIDGRLVHQVGEDYDHQEIHVVREVEPLSIDTKKGGLSIKQPDTCGEITTPHSSGSNPPQPPGDNDLAASQLPDTSMPWRQAQNKIWRRPGPTGYTGTKVGMLSGFVHLLWEKLRELLEQEHVLLSKDVRTEINRLIDVINDWNLWRESFYHDGNNAVDRINRVRELFCDIEDWADLLALRITSHERGKPSLSWFSRPCYHALNKLTRHPAAHRDIYSELRNLVDRAQLINEELLLLHPYEDLLFAPDHYHCSLTSQDVMIEEVIKMLANVTDLAELKIISITGMAGSGKTTLAEAVYQRLQGKFDKCMIVSVGQEKDMARKTLMDMLSKAMAHRGSKDLFGKLEMELQGSEDTNQLATKVRESLRNKRYLIVVDDLWSRDHWEIIRFCFPEDNLHSRIIITTRNDALAWYCSSGSSDCIYKIGLLSDADSEQLFLKASGTGYSENISSQVMKKCGGLPLAIVSVAAMLARDQSKVEWSRIGSNLLSNPDTNYMLQRLNLSYNDLLPHYLKICMLYLSIFPESYEIDVEHLVRLWIAEGFIDGASGRTIEETARSYLDGLISRNMVLPLQVNHDDIPKRCMVHPVIHDFIVQKSQTENFVTIVNDQHQDTAISSGKIRRLSLQGKSKQDRYMAQIGNLDLSHAHSVIVIGPSSTMPHLSSLRVVRVLVLEGCDAKVCLDGLHNLQLLKYLSLRGTDISELPETIGELRFLQTLDVRSTNVKKLPTSIVSLEKLMHLLCGSAELPRGIAKMEALHTVSCTISMNSTTSVIQELSELVDLRELELFYDLTEMPENEKQVKFSCHGFQRLKKLCILCGSASSVTFEPSVLQRVKILELSFVGLLDEKSTGVSGIEHLLNLKHVLLEFSQNDAGAMAMMNAVRKAAATVHPNHPEVTVNVDGRPLVLQSIK